MQPGPRHYASAARGLEAALEQPAEGANGVIETVLATTADVLGIESSCWHLTDPASGTPVEAGALGEPPGSFEESLTFEFGPRGDYNRIRDLAAGRRHAASLSASTAGERRASPRFREMIEPTGASDELRLLLADSFGVWAVIAGFTSRELTPEDLGFAASILPVATAALRRATAETVARTAPAATAVPEGGTRPSVVLLDASDRIVSADAGARARLALLPEYRAVEVPGVIAYLAAAARVQERAQARMRALDGAWFDLDAMALDAGGEGGVAVVISPAASAAVREHVLRLFGLSAREREVAALLLEGRSVKAIAAELVLSPWTVADHVKAIYAKTGVGSRSELGALA